MMCDMVFVNRVIAPMYMMRMRYNKVTFVHHQHCTISGGEFTHRTIVGNEVVLCVRDNEHIDCASDDPGHMMHDASHIPRASDRVCYVRLHV